ncbi:MAG: MATE family efflux transporter [Selenomonadaceae bacterium]|nr:MATE family efflux transporter [Selenomonadaceae bacterium]
MSFKPKPPAEEIKLSDHFTFRRLLKFTFPSISMVVFMSVYGVVDGFFVSNFVGKIPFAALNFIMPFLLLLCFIGFLFGTGGGALIAKTLGEGDKVKANRIFSMLVYVSFALGILFAIFGMLELRRVVEFLGARGELLEMSLTYGRIALLGLPMYVLQSEFQILFSTAEKPQLGFYMTVAAGVANIALDAVFILGLDWGLEGAAAATALSECLGGILPLIYFARPNSSLLRLTKTKFDGKALWQTCTNGISELLTSVSMSLVGMLYNWQLLNYAGSDGVAAYGVLMYVNFIFVSIFIGYEVGASPLVSYHFGAQNFAELKNLLQKSLVLISAFATVMFLSAELLARPMASIFVGYDAGLLALTARAFRIYAFSYLFSGFAIFSSAFFTALNNGLISAVISALRTLVFEVTAVMVFPLLWGLDGIWLAMVGAEVMAVAVASLFLYFNRKKYRYW